MEQQVSLLQESSLTKENCGELTKIVALVCLIIIELEERLSVLTKQLENVESRASTAESEGIKQEAFLATCSMYVYSTKNEREDK